MFFLNFKTIILQSQWQSEWEGVDVWEDYLILVGM